MSKTAREHQYVYGIALQQEATKIYGKMLLFAAALLMSHLLGIEPSEAETLGLKFTIPNPVILHGALALIFLHYLFRLISFSERGTSLFHMRAEAAQIRHYIRLTRKYAKRKKTPKEIKKSAKGNMIFYQIVMAPYWICATLIMIIAFLAAIIDCYQMTAYVVNHSRVVADVLGYEVENATVPNEAGNIVTIKQR